MYSQSREHFWIRIFAFSDHLRERMLNHVDRKMRRTRLILGVVQLCMLVFQNTTTLVFMYEIVGKCKLPADWIRFICITLFISYVRDFVFVCTNTNSYIKDRWNSTFAYIRLRCICGVQKKSPRTMAMGVPNFSKRILSRFTLAE